MNDITVMTLYVTTFIQIFRDRKIDCAAFNFIHEDYKAFHANLRVQGYNRRIENRSYK